MKIKTNVWWVEKAEQFAIQKDRPFAKAWEPLYTHSQLLEVIEQCAKVCLEFHDYTKGIAPILAEKILKLKGELL